MVEDMPAESRTALEADQGRTDLIIDTGEYLDNVYKDWVSANTITDDTTLIGYHAKLDKN
jgi:hypothetical protein